MTAVVVGPGRAGAPRARARGARRSSSHGRRARLTDGGVCVSVLVLTERTCASCSTWSRASRRWTDVLAALQRDELSMPLRFVVAAARAPSLMGFMPAHRGGGTPLVLAQGDRDLARRTRPRGLDPHQGAVLLHDGDTGELMAILNASAVTEIRTAAVSAVATQAARPPGAARRRRPRRRRAGPLSRRGDASGARRSRDPDLEPEPAARRGSRGDRDAARSWPLDRGRAAPAPTSSARARRRASRSSRSRCSHPGRTSTPSARRSRPRESSTSEVVAAASLFVDRRESTLNESGDYLFAVEEAGHRARSHRGRARRGARRACTRAASDDDELTRLQVARHRGRGSRGCGARRRDGRGSAGSARRSSSDPARRDRARPRA